MISAEQYRKKAAEFAKLSDQASTPDEKQALRDRQHSQDTLADNQDWLTDNFERTLHAPDQAETDVVALAKEEEHVLRHLGAAVIMQWNTLPTKLQRELFDKAGSMGDMIETKGLRAQIARFLHAHKDDAR
jgi:hypothetical protein